MIKFASPSVSRPPFSAVSELQCHPRLGTDHWVIGNPTIPIRFRYVESPIKELTANDFEERLKKQDTSNRVAPAPLWKVLLDGMLAFLFVTFVFATSGWMLYQFSMEVVSLGDFQFLDFLKRCY